MRIVLRPFAVRHGWSVGPQGWTGGRCACGADDLRWDESTRNSPSGGPGALPKDHGREQPEGQIDDHHLLLRSGLTVTATARGAGEEAFAHLSRDESQAIFQPLIFDLSVTISRRAAILKASPNDPAQGSDDLAASPGSSGPERQKPPTLDCRKQTAAVLQCSRVQPFLLLETWCPQFRRAPPAAWISAPVDYAGGYRFSPPRQEHLVCPQYVPP